MVTLLAMSTSVAHCDWLPDHQLHAVPTLAQVDRLIAHLSRIVHDYTDQSPLALAEIGEAIGSTSAAVLRLATAVRAELRDEWIVSPRRNLSNESVDALHPDTPVVLPTRSDH
jgi:predicted transcriptional regulator